MREIRNRIVGHRLIPAGELKRNPRNWRRHPDTQRAALATSLELVGWVGEALIVETRDGPLLLDGHLRADLADDQPVPCTVVELSDDEASLVLASLDTIGTMAEGDPALVREILEALDLDALSAAAEVALENVRRLVDSVELTWPLTEPKAGRTDPDDVPPTPSEPVTKRGDLWLLGDHRLLCGDAGNESDHEHLIGSASIDLVLTDPPYGVGIDYGESTDDSAASVMQIIDRALPLIRRWPVALITSGARLLWRYPEPSWILAWVHPAGMGSGPWGFTCLNPVLAYGADPYLKHQLGGRADALVLAADREDVAGHPVIKPLKVWEWLMERGSTRSGDHVLDPFVGSGTTLIACERLGRRCYAMEIEPRYVDVAVERWRAFTGREPVLEKARRNGRARQRLTRATVAG